MVGEVFTIFSLRTKTSLVMILSSSCLERDSPMDFTKSKKSLDKWLPDIMIAAWPRVDEP
jgi:hypothetical protein